MILLIMIRSYLFNVTYNTTPYHIIEIYKKKILPIFCLKLPIRYSTHIFINIYKFKLNAASFSFQTTRTRWNNNNVKATPFLTLPSNLHRIVWFVSPSTIIWYIFRRVGIYSIIYHCMGNSIDLISVWVCSSLIQ